MVNNENAGMEPIDFALLPQCASADADGRLLFGGRDIEDLCREFGTPTLFYDLVDIEARFRRALSAFGPRVAYASKAFLSGHIVDIANRVGISLDVATDGEYELAVAAGFPPSRLVVHGNNKTDRLLEWAVRDEVQWVVVDNDGDISRLGELCKGSNTRVRVLVRVNPGIEVHTHEYVATGNRDSKFGFPIWTGEAERAVQDVSLHDRLEFMGLHTHIGSSVYSLENFSRGLRSFGPLIRESDPRVVVAGGGLGVRYTNADEAPTLDEWATAIAHALREVDFAGSALAEPGRCLVAPAALTAYRVGSVRSRRQIEIVAIDGGMSDNPRPLLYKSEYEAFLSERVLDHRHVEARIVGSHCETGDTLVERAFLQRVPARGDIVVTPVTGAYGYGLSSNYNRMPRAAIVYVRGREAKVGIRREMFDDMRRLDSFFD